MLRGNEKTIGLHKAAPRNLGSFTVADADGKKGHADGVPFFTWWTLGGYSGGKAASVTMRVCAAAFS